MPAPNTTGIRFLYNFAVGVYDFTNPGANIFSITSEADGDHTGKNLTTTPLRETWRSDENIGSFQDIIIEANDLSVVPDTFAILNHNLSDTAVIQVQGSLSSDFTTPAFTFAFDWTEKHLVLLQDVVTAYPFYRFRILDPTNPCGFLEIGRIIAGRSFTVTFNEDISDDISISTQDLAYRMNTEGFFRAFNERVKVEKLNVRFDKLETISPNDSNYLNLQEMFNEVGETYPFLTILDPDDPGFKVIWGMIDIMPTKSFVVNRFVSMPLSIQEVY